MSDIRPELERFNPAILSPGFFNTVTNAAAMDDGPFLRAQLARHLFHCHPLAGAEMHDRHGFVRAMAAAFGVRETSIGYGRETIPNLAAIFDAGPARRVAILVDDTDRLIASDVQRFLTLTSVVESAADSLKASTPSTQLLMFLLGPTGAFPSIDCAAKRRAESEPAIKLVRGDIKVCEWTAPVDFDLGPRHQLTLSHADWYFCSRGRRAEDAGTSWHCIEEDDHLIFFHADDGAPSFEGVFARLPKGMQLVGIRYESDDARRQVSLVAEDPFTAFRQLCQRLGLC